MQRVHTPSVLADVMDVMTLRDVPDERLVTDSVCRFRAVRPLHLGVGVLRLYPHPALVINSRSVENFLPEIPPSDAGSLSHKVQYSTFPQPLLRLQERYPRAVYLGEKVAVYLGEKV